VKFRGAILPTRRSSSWEEGRDPHATAVFDTQGYVDGRLAFEARITGMWV
jgi:hypothetical protein